MLGWQRDQNAIDVRTDLDVDGMFVDWRRCAGDQYQSRCPPRSTRFKCKQHWKSFRALSLLFWFLLSILRFVRNGNWIIECRMARTSVWVRFFCCLVLFYRPPGTWCWSGFSGQTHVTAISHRFYRSTRITKKKFIAKVISSMYNNIIYKLNQIKECTGCPKCLWMCVWCVCVFLYLGVCILVCIWEFTVRTLIHYMLDSLRTILNLMFDNRFTNWLPCQGACDAMDRLARCYVYRWPCCHRNRRRRSIRWPEFLCPYGIVWWRHRLHYEFSLQSPRRKRRIRKCEWMETILFPGAYLQRDKYGEWTYLELIGGGQFSVNDLFTERSDWIACLTHFLYLVTSTIACAWIGHRMAWVTVGGGFQYNRTLASVTKINGKFGCLSNGNNIHAIDPKSRYIIAASVVIHAGWRTFSASAHTVTWVITEKNKEKKINRISTRSFSFHFIFYRYSRTRKCTADSAV